MKRRVVVIPDPHCGHLAGLTHPSWQLKLKEKGATKRNKWAVLERELWDEYCTILKELAPIHNCFGLGDYIDGKGRRSGGTELITTDRDEQTDMAVAVFDQVRLNAAPAWKEKDGTKNHFKIVGVYGTGYHAGDDEDWENIVAERADFEKIGSHEWVDVNGHIFDLKHHLSGTSVAYTKGTAISKERLDNLLWAEHEEQPKADTIIRAHVHRSHFCGDGETWLGMVCPGLQGMGSKYGARRMSKRVNWGIPWFDVNDDGTLADWGFKIKYIKAQKAKILKL